MEPRTWGPHLWFSLHTVTLTYPFYPDSKQKEDTKNFFMSLQNVLPCALCREHYKTHLEAHPIDNALGSRAELVQWLIDVHNSVNVSLGKREWSLDEVIAQYEKIYGHPIMIHPGTTELVVNDLNVNSEDMTLYYGIAIIGLIFLFYLGWSLMDTGRAKGRRRLRH